MLSCRQLLRVRSNATERQLFQYVMQFAAFKLPFLGSMLTETGPWMCVEKATRLKGAGLSNDIHNWSELDPLRHEELAPLLS